MRWSHEGPGQWSKTSQSFTRKLMNSASGLQISWRRRRRKRKRKKKQAAHHSCVCKRRHLFYSSIFHGCDELWIQPPLAPPCFWPEMPQQQNSSVPREPEEGSTPLWHKTDPNLGHKDWVRTAGGIAFPWEWSIPSLFYSLWPRSCLPTSYFCIFSSAPPSSVCITFLPTPQHTLPPPHSSSITITVLKQFISWLFFFWLMHSFKITITNHLWMQIYTLSHFRWPVLKSDKKVYLLNCLEKWICTSRHAAAN